MEIYGNIEIEIDIDIDKMTVKGEFVKKMRTIKAEEITQVVRDLCIEANCHLPSDIKDAITECKACEPFEIARNILDKIEENYQIADEDNVPICQDTGLACVFLEIGQDVHIEGNLKEAVDEGVRRGYTEGFLRKSCVKDPIDRVNTGDNTPAVIYYDLVPGDQVKITVAPKGFGSENMSQIKMLKPSDGLQGVKDFILKVVEDAGPNPCPPIVVGVGIREMKIRFTAGWKKKCWKKSMPLVSDHRDLEAEQQHLLSTLKHCRPILQVFHVQSTSTAM